MDNIYDKLNEINQDNPKAYEPQYTKEEYAQMKKEERQAVYDKAEAQTLNVVASPQNYLAYLSLQSRIDYTVTNTLLVMSENPNATFLKDSAHWRENKIFPKKDEKGIEILEPSGEFRRADNSIGTNYNVKKVFDVSQMNTKNNFTKPPLSAQVLLSALTFKSPVNIRQQTTPLGKSVLYSKEENTIFFQPNLPINELLKGLVHEYCSAEFDKQYETRDNFIVDSSSYVLCQKYGITVDDTSFINNMNEHFNGLDSRAIKEELNTIKGLADDVNSRVELGITSQKEQAKETRDMER
ncbi:MAG: hypothetical protein RR623_01615 [Bacilli bacterium]